MDFGGEMVTLGRSDDLFGLLSELSSFESSLVLLSSWFWLVDLASGSKNEVSLD